MTYVEGFVAAVPTANKDTYRAHADSVAPLLKEFGVTRMVECWGDDVKKGKLTDFQGAVQAKEDETVVFSWFEYPDKLARDAASHKIMNDPRMKEMGEAMPFDGKRMIYGGFASMLDEGDGGAMGYVDGFLAPVEEANQEAYREMASKASIVIREHGATRVVETWGDDVPDGTLTDHRRAVQAIAGENIVYSWIEWPSKDARDAGWEKIMADERMQNQPADMPFDGKRMIYGGFAPILDV